LQVFKDCKARLLQGKKDHTAVLPSAIDCVRIITKKLFSDFDAPDIINEPSSGLACPPPLVRRVAPHESLDDG